VRGEGGRILVALGSGPLRREAGAPPRRAFWRGSWRCCVQVGQHGEEGAGCLVGVPCFLSCGASTALPAGAKDCAQAGAEEALLALQVVQSCFLSRGGGQPTACTFAFILRRQSLQLLYL